MACEIFDLPMFAMSVPSVYFQQLKSGIKLQDPRLILLLEHDRKQLHIRQPNVSKLKPW